jgi:hypothetical protein
MDLVAEIVQSYNTAASYKTIINFQWASSFIYCFTTLAVFLGIAVVAMQRPYRGLVRKNSRE